MDLLPFVFQDARKKKKKSIKYYQTRLKIPLGILQKLDDGEWDAIPKGVSSRAFVRQYGQILGIDEFLLMQLLDYLQEDAQLKVVPIIHKMPTVNKKKKKYRFIWFFLIILMLTVYWYFWLTGGNSYNFTKENQEISTKKIERKQDVENIQPLVEDFQDMSCVKVTFLQNCWVEWYDKSGQIKWWNDMLKKGAVQFFVPQGVLKFGNAAAVRIEMENMEYSFPNAHDKVYYVPIDIED